MNWACLMVALVLTAVLAFVSCMQLLYLESLRLIRRETPSLEFFRETLVGKVGLEPEQGSLSFSLVKHVCLFLIGVFYLCAFVRPGVPAWQSVLEAAVVSLFAMLTSTYLIPHFFYRRTTGRWLEKTVPVARLLAASA